MRYERLKVFREGVGTKVTSAANEDLNQAVLAAQ
jgi:hypothetical protein